MLTMEREVISVQTTLDLDCPTVKEQEKRIKKLLRQYRTIDPLIDSLRMRAKGIGLSIQPRITMSYGADEDNVTVMYALYHEALTEQQEIVVTTAKKYLNAGKLTYATYSRVAKLLSTEIGETREENDILQGLYQMLRDAAKQEEYIHLTDTEKIAIARANEIERARQQLDTLEGIKMHVGHALGILQTYYLEEYNLLVYRYIQDRTVLEVCSLLARGGCALTDGEYRHLRESAIGNFSTHCPAYIFA